MFMFWEGCPKPHDTADDLFWGDPCLPTSLHIKGHCRLREKSMVFSFPSSSFSLLLFLLCLLGVFCPYLPLSAGYTMQVHDFADGEGQLAHSPLRVYVNCCMLPSTPESWTTPYPCRISVTIATNFCVFLHLFAEFMGCSR